MANRKTGTEMNDMFRNKYTHQKYLTLQAFQEVAILKNTTLSLQSYKAILLVGDDLTLEEFM